MIHQLRIQRRAFAASAAQWPERMHPVLRRVYAARGIVTVAQVEHRLGALLAPTMLSGIERACELLESALRKDASIVVVGDYDCDGATGTAVAIRGLRMLGARRVAYRVPNRFIHGYGLSTELVEDLVAQRPNLLITVDNGVAAVAGVACAKRHGIDVIVTDHHLPGASLPAADAIVNPNLDGDAFPSKALAGVGVMFYLLLALRSRLRAQGWFTQRAIAEPDLSTLLDLVALGTVADLVPLDFNNRVLVDAGLRRIRAGRGCAGMAALIELSQRSAATLTAGDLAFSLGPRVNAAGRLEDMALGIECLLADNPERARDLAQTLCAINTQRRDLQAGMVEQGEASIDECVARLGAAALPVGVVLYQTDWHPGVVGLVASRLKDKLHRPVIACAPVGEDRDEVRGSGRSIPSFHLRDALVDVAAKAPGLLQRFGGHAMAAGLSLRRADVPRFAELFDCVARARIAPGALDPILYTDGELSAADFSLDLARQLRFAGPWGQGFPEPLFDNEFTVESWKPMGETHLRLRLHLVDRAPAFDAVMFNAFDGNAPPPRLRAAFQLEVDEWNNSQKMRVLLRHYEPV